MGAFPAMYEAAQESNESGHQIYITPANQFQFGIFIGVVGIVLLIAFILNKIK